jgi:hypothetical protein
MSIVLPNESTIVEQLMPYCNDDQTQEFIQWFAKRSERKEFYNAMAVEAELASALDDYADAGLASRAVVKIWYVIKGSVWVKALTG